MTVLVVVTDAEEAGPLIRWGGRFARAREQTLTVLYVSRGAKPNAGEELPLEDPADEHPIRVPIRDAIWETVAMLCLDDLDHGVPAHQQVEAQRQRAIGERTKREDSRAISREDLAAAQDAASSDPAEGEASAPAPAPESEQPSEAPAAEQAAPEGEVAAEGAGLADTAPADSPQGGAEGSPEPALDAPTTADSEGAGDALADPGTQISAKATDFVKLRSLSHSRQMQGVQDEIRELKPTLVVVGRHEALSSAGLEDDLGDLLLDAAPCDVMLLRATATSGQRCSRVLVPASGGPHAKVSLKLAEGLTRDGAEVYPLYVEPEGGDAEDSLAVGRSRLLKVMAEAGVDARIDRITPRVEIGDDVTRAIGTAAQDDFDLVLVGASDKGFASRLLFRTIPERLLATGEGTAMAVVRRGKPLGERAALAFGEFIRRTVPQLERDDRRDLFERLEAGSKFNLDFVTLISLSTAIASLGLLQNSPAVVIGAMLVAPLMVPMIGAGLALVQGNYVLVREASKSIGFGFLTALLIGVCTGALFGFVMPPDTLTPELLARGGPTLLDLFVAFASGIAAAYANARPNLSGALPGVAIAAALVPPIGTVGISLAHGDFVNGGGAALLFGTNLVAIVLGSALTFRAIGVHANREASSRRIWSRRLALSLIVILLALTVPLLSGLLSLVSQKNREIRLTPELRLRLEARVEAANATFVSVGRSYTRDVLEVVVASQQGRDPKRVLADELSLTASKTLGRHVVVRLLVLRHAFEVESGAVAPGQPPPATPTPTPAPVTSSSR